MDVVAKSRDHALGVVDEPEIQVHRLQSPNDAVEALERDLAVALARDVEVVVGDGELAVVGVDGRAFELRPPNPVPKRRWSAPVT